ncbi:DNA polymerase III subunit delta' [Hyphococcus sp. DH-69]|uniref:DNA polymerase III subunit delta' n=1 Tax=Hyphococcus formosus TaxID=3143534 RepID=UPI00398AF37E
MENELIHPNSRANQFGRTELERKLRATMDEGVFSHGWIIAGPEGSGKATLAYRIARAALDPDALVSADSFDMPETSRTFRQISAHAHPDLFVAERLWDEKKAKFQSEITVETVRKLTSFLGRTASGGGARVAIVDTADDLNRNAANALLKVLEEPPRDTLLLLLSSAPGRLLPTIRSRCRRVELPEMPDDAVKDFLISEGVDDTTASSVASFAHGRPGYALTLTAGDGVDAIGLANAFLKATQSNSDISKIISGVTGKAGEGRWPVFRDTVLSTISDGARSAALGMPHKMFPKNISAGALLEGWENLSRLVVRGEAVNLDRGQLIMAMAHDLRSSMRGSRV